MLWVRIFSRWAPARNTRILASERIESHLLLKQSSGVFLANSLQTIAIPLEDFPIGVPFAICPNPYASGAHANLLTA